MRLRPPEVMEFGLSLLDRLLTRAARKRSAPTPSPTRNGLTPFSSRTPNNGATSGVRRLIAVALAAVVTAGAADPTFLRRRIPDIQPQSDELTANATGASYRPAFGVGDAQAGQLKGIARYGELTVESGGASAVVSYASEEQIYYLLDGDGVLLYGDQKAPVKKDDFLYIPAGVRHGIANTSQAPVRVMVMGFKIPQATKVGPTSRLMLANAGDVPLTTLASHGPTTQFKLLMGTTESKRDKLAAASQMVSLFLMDFAPGGTNIPHHHEMEEEIYYILRGSGDMVAGGGADGNEGRYPACAGDAFFIRLNATVGFYSGARDGGEHDLILAVRSRYPFPSVRE
jgi:mannose-6-phosphate isomerase-like protein (cupin superfamily)